MGMQEVLNALEKNGELTSHQISEVTKCSITSVIKSMKRLMKDVSVNLTVRKLTDEEKLKLYGNKVGARIFIYKLY